MNGEVPRNIDQIGTSRLAARGTLQIMAGQGVLLVSGYFISILLARKFGPAKYGIYGVILSVLVWVEQIGRFGIPSATNKMIAEDGSPAQIVAHSAEALLLTASLLLFVIFWLAAPFLGGLFHISKGTTLFRLAALDIPFCGLYFAFQGVLVGYRKFGPVSIGLAIYGLTKLVGILAVVAMGLTIPKALVVNVLATVGGLFFLGSKVSLKNFRPSYEVIVPMVRLALPIGLYLLGLQVLYNLDLWCLRILEPDSHSVVGIYIAALNVARITLISSMAVGIVVLPSVSFALAQQDADLVQRYVQGATRFLCVILLPVCAVVAVNSAELMTFIYSNDYTPGGAFLSLLIFGFGLHNLLVLFCVLLTAYGSPLLSAVAVLSTIPLFYLLNITLIPRFGPAGAAASVILTGIPGVIVTGILCYKRYGPLISKSTLVRVTLSTAVVAAMSTQVSAAGYFFFVKYAGLFVVCILVLALLGELKFEDFQPLMLWRREEP